MNRIPIDECPAGPEIDAIAAKVLGWQIASDSFFRAWLSPGGSRISNDDWIPSADIATAWKLVEEEDLFAEHYLVKNEGSHYVMCPKCIGFGEWPEYYRGADSNPALVITRAYLKAKGVEFVEVADEPEPA